jgi:hypothetical protein
MKSTFRFITFIAVLAMAAVGIAAEGADAPNRADAHRGGLLYEAACGECHTTQAHWREKHIVTTWPELLFQVERWQRVAGRGWSAQEIEDVAAYLNARFYRMPCPRTGCNAQPT